MAQAIPQSVPPSPRRKKPAHPDDWTSFERLIIIDEEHRMDPIDESQYVLKIWTKRTILEHIVVPEGPDV